MIGLLMISLGMLVIALILLAIRLNKGPTNLDRAVTLDVVTSASMGIVVVVMAISGRIDLLPLLVLFASVGFISSTAIARFSQSQSIINLSGSTDTGVRYPESFSIDTGFAGGRIENDPGELNEEIDDDADELHPDLDENEEE